MDNIENSNFIIKSTIFILLASIFITLIIFFSFNDKANLDISVADSLSAQVLGTLETEHLKDSTANVEVKFASDREDIKALYYYIDFGNAQIKNVTPLSDQTNLDYIVVGTGISGAVPCSDDDVNVSFALGTFPFDKPFEGSLLCIQASTLNSESVFQNGKVMVSVELEFPTVGSSQIKMYQASRYVNTNNQNIYLNTSDVILATYNVFQNSDLSCGNSIVDPGEQCDDGNELDGDMCSANCLTSCAENEFYFDGSCINPQDHKSTSTDIIIENEDFDVGENFDQISSDNSNATYFDKNGGFIGNFFEQNPNNFIYRKSEVDIKRIPSSIDGYAIGYAQTGEWLDYTVDIPATGDYNFYLSAQAPTGESDNLLSLDMDGSNIISDFTFIPNVDQWDVPKNGAIFSEQKISTISLEQGTHKFRLNIKQEFVDLNYMRLEKVEQESGDIEINCGNLDINGDQIIDLKDFVDFIELLKKFSSNVEVNNVICIDSPFTTSNSCGARDFNNDSKINEFDYKNLISKYSSDGSIDCSEN